MTVETMRLMIQGNVNTTLMMDAHLYGLCNHAIRNDAHNTIISERVLTTIFTSPPHANDLQNANPLVGVGCPCLATSWGGGSCTHTNSESSPFWRVDLEQQVAVNTVKVVNRGG